MTSPTQSAMEQQQREAFEAVARHLGLSLEKNSIDGEYISNETWGVFHVWQESLASELRSLRDSLALARSHIGELREALERVLEAWASFEKYGEISHLDGQPLIYASTLEELADAARAALNKEKP